jgi:hypothetical protein
MTAKPIYATLCILGTVLPYAQLLPFLRDHGLDVRLIVAQLFANRISSFFGLDVVVSTMVLWVFVAVEGRRLRMAHLWAPVAASLTVGVSLALPLFLYLREHRLAIPSLPAVDRPPSR